MTSKKNYALGITSVDIEIRGLLQTPSMRIIGLALSTPTWSLAMGIQPARTKGWLSHQMALATTQQPTPTTGLCLEVTSVPGTEQQSTKEPRRASMTRAAARARLWRRLVNLLVTRRVSETLDKTKNTDLWHINKLHRSAILSSIHEIYETEWHQH